MRITFLLPSYGWKPAGGLRVAYEYANGLVARGHEVAMVHPRRGADAPLPPTGSLSRRLQWEAARFRDRAFRPSVNWQHIDGRVRMLYVLDLDASRVPDADVVVATAFQTAEYAIGYPASKGAKFYLIQHYETWAGPKDRVDATWRAPLHKVVISRWLLEIGRELGCERIECIPNGLDHKKYGLLTPISTRPERVATLLHADNWKGSADALEALGLARKHHPELQVALFGTPPRWLSVPEWVEYFRNPPQKKLVNQIYNGSSIYLCASWAEGFALPPAEAMACGCAVASTDCGGVREFAEHEVTALLSPPRDPQSLARNVLRLVDDDELRQKLARAGRDRIEGFTWERSTDRLERLFKKIL